MLIASKNNGILYIRENLRLVEDRCNIVSAFSVLIDVTIVIFVFHFTHIIVCRKKKYVKLKKVVHQIRIISRKHQKHRKLDIRINNGYNKAKSNMRLNEARELIDVVILRIVANAVPRLDMSSVIFGKNTDHNNDTIDSIYHQKKLISKYENMETAKTIKRKTPIHNIKKFNNREWIS